MVSYVARAIVPRGFPETQRLKRIVESGESLDVRGQAMVTIKQSWRTIVYDICNGLAAHDIATKYGIGERSLWNFLKAINVTMRDIQEACREEEEFKRMTKLEKLQKKQERLKVLPTSLEDFRKLEIIQELERQLRLKGDTEEAIKRNIKAIYECALFKAKHPEDITIEDILEFLDYKRLEWQENGKDLRKPEVLSQFSTHIVSPLRVWCKYRGLPIPPALTTTEYHSPYRKVRITVEQRYSLLSYLKENYPGLYDKARAILIFLYETGSRVSALRRAQFLETEEFGVKVAYVITEEKGKRAQIRWEKPINPRWYPYVKGRLPLGVREVERIKEVLKEAYEQVLPEGLTKYYALKHPYHVWRHTAANDLLEASGFNLMLVAQKLGWRNVQMIVNVYGTMDKAMLLRLSGYDVKYEASKFEFLYNDYERRAREEGLI